MGGQRPDVSHVRPLRLWTLRNQPEQRKKK